MSVVGKKNLASVGVEAEALGWMELWTEVLMVLVLVLVLILVVVLILILVLVLVLVMAVVTVGVKFIAYLQGKTGELVVGKGY